MLQNSFRLSAYKRQFWAVTVTMTLMNIMNKSGPELEPCGTPEVGRTSTDL